MSRKPVALPLVLLALTGTACGWKKATPPSTSAAAPAATGSAAGAPATGTPATSTGAATALDPCALFTAADAKAVVPTAGAGRKVAAGELQGCVYDGAVLIDTRPFAGTAGQATPVTGLGDAAVAFAKAGIVEALKGSTVISVTTADVAPSKKVAALAMRG